MNALYFALVAAAANVVGALAVVRHERRSLTVIETFMAFGAGFMLAVALVEVAPEAWARGGQAPLYMLLGYLAVHITQHAFVPHFHFGEETHRVSAGAGLTALIGLLLHTFFDGVAIASGFAVSSELGLLLFLAVFLHKLPEGVAMASVALASGQGRRRALLAAGALGIATIVGVVLTDTLAPLQAHGLALSAGVTIYVAASNLVPEIQGQHGWRMPLALLGGAVAFFLSKIAVEAGMR